MAHESGVVSSSREALIDVRFTGDALAECVVDTGFDGGLVLPRPFVDNLKIPVIGSLTFETVGGAKIVGQVALAVIEWLGETREVEIVISEGYDALIGTELLANTTLVINYTSQVVMISK